MAERKIGGWTVRAIQRDGWVETTIIKPLGNGRFDYRMHAFEPRDLDPPDAPMLTPRALKSVRYDRAAQEAVAEARLAGWLERNPDDAT